MSAGIVLIVEDHADTREMYVEALSVAGFNAVEAADAEDALRRAVTLRPAVVVTDLRLGSGADGLDLCEKLREDPDTADIPMIVVTGWTSDRNLRRRAEASGCAAVLLKPVLPDTLTAVIQQVLDPQPSGK